MSEMLCLMGARLLSAPERVLDVSDMHRSTPQPTKDRTETGGMAMTEHRVGTQEEWQAARDQLLAQEEELTPRNHQLARARPGVGGRERAPPRRNDELARKRRGLPWVAVEKEYSFQTAGGTRSLAEL